MPDVLSQHEVDALLNSVTAEEAFVMAAAPVAAPARPAVSAETASRAARTPVEFNTYDFKRPERVSQDQIRSIEMMHEVLARKLSSSLSGYLRTIVDVKLASTDQFTYQEFLMSIPNPTCFNVLLCDPLDGQMVLEINPSIVFPILDKILGGNAADNYIPDRDMTTIEWRLVGHIVNETLKFLKESWRPIMEIDFRVAATDTNPMLMQIVPPNEVVILLCFEIKMANNTGMLNLCIPFPVIEPKIHEFSTIQTWFQTRRTTDAVYEAQKLNDSIKDAEVELVTFIGKTAITMRQFLSLKPGDLLLTKKDVTDPLLVKLAGKPKFWATAGQHRKFKAIQVVGAAAEDDDL